jgi:succinyl-diaminopimelate desuccinylase
VRDHVDVAALVEATRGLVAIDTQNPPGRERGAADVARQLLEPFGARFEEVEPEPGRVSLVASVGACDGTRPVLMVNGHLDVVPVDPAAWQHAPFGGEEHDGRLFGRGTSDMKGGIAAAIEALAVLQRVGSEPACDVVFHLVADEEVGGGLGARVLLDQGFIRGDACIDPEPTSMGVCVAERGLLQARVELQGVPAHASEPRKGISAIEKAARVVLALHGADYDEEHPLLGRPSSNAGMIRGGSAYNVVAERSTVYIDRRVLPGTTAEIAAKSVRDKIDAIDDPELHYALEVDVFGEASEMAPDHPFVAMFQDAYAAALGAPGPIIGMQFTTDARFVRNQAGIPAIVCGPGDLDQAHVVDESVSIERLVDAAVLYAHLYAGFAQV